MSNVWLLIAVVTTFSLVTQSYAVAVPDHCSSMCKFDPHCNRAKGSYCMREQTPSTCSGYYFTSEMKDYVYFSSSGDNRRTDFPVLCADARKILETDEPLVRSKSKPRAPNSARTIDYCSELCKLDSVCRKDKHGSYVKEARALERRHCFGYYISGVGSNEYLYYTGGSFPKKYPMYHQDAERIVNITRSQ